MEIKLNDTVMCCEFGTCNSNANYKISFDDVSNYNDIYICESCAYELMKKLEKVFRSKKNAKAK